MTFKQDRLENEKNDPSEASSLKFINIPIILISIFVGFGISYLALKTKDAAMTPGDSRTVPASGGTSENAAAQGNMADLLSLMEKGKQVFTTTCQACHQATGAGIPGAFPPVSESEWVSGPPKRLVAIILHGLQGEIYVKGQKFQGVMPPFKDQLKAEDIAAVATYVRNSFGNKADLVSVETVNQVKEATKSRAAPWNGESELNGQKWD
ncbi:MAG: cytochrome c [Bdellovibrionaceae bacterium]|nr:cytochrome c [Pseudobdellovibrionaceae bacterium]